ncbi:hypothetical protein JMY81_02365 [Brenneria goodwinii]|nr:hypothetical protein [Brenneria goodwinii]MCG8156615.1 hypothetical protein [Brenneria goodwinii]MCG8159683.1 hypothetical protein [Brenneria goodwinii]MCG8165773.1 hypothetical protein [Brenneria goodwinii]MCG8170266.1 hypothetical protein [Brenneria goodwinii]MCG8173542.1 hypothetical protein [Brenneria goodwinii]
MTKLVFVAGVGQAATVLAFFFGVNNGAVAFLPGGFMKTLTTHHELKEE